MPSPPNWPASRRSPGIQKLLRRNRRGSERLGRSPHRRPSRRWRKRASAAAGFVVRGHRSGRFDAIHEQGLVSPRWRRSAPCRHPRQPSEHAAATARRLVGATPEVRLDGDGRSTRAGMTRTLRGNRNRPAPDRCDRDMPAGVRGLAAEVCRRPSSNPTSSKRSSTSSRRSARSTSIASSAAFAQTKDESHRPQAGRGPQRPGRAPLPAGRRRQGTHQALPPAVQKEAEKLYAVLNADYEQQGPSSTRSPRRSSRATSAAGRRSSTAPRPRASPATRSGTSAASRART